MSTDPQRSTRARIAGFAGNAAAITLVALATGAGLSGSIELAAAAGALGVLTCATTLVTLGPRPRQPAVVHLIAKLDAAEG